MVRLHGQCSQYIRFAHYRSCCSLKLQLLAVSDLCVVCGCALLYGLPLPSFPDLWSLYYDKRIFPIILPYLLPTVQV